MLGRLQRLQSELEILFNNMPIAGQNPEMHSVASRLKPRQMQFQRAFPIGYGARGDDATLCVNDRDF